MRNPKVEKKALVIQAQANRDWKEASGSASRKQSKRQKYGIPEAREAGKANEDAGREAEVLKARQAFGLNVMKRDDAVVVGPSADEEVEVEKEEEKAEEVKPVQQAEPKTDDQRALDALLGVKEDSTLVLPAANEHEAFERDFRTAPEMATLQEYEAVPVEEFGAAMLRGMGWKEGQGIGNQKGRKLEKVKVLERRPALLGIGAKADAAVAAELGAWGRGAGGKQRREQVVYNPLTLRNKRTGEELTEEELKIKLATQKEEQTKGRLAPEKEEKRRRKDDYDSDEEYERKRRERRKERDYDDGYRSSRREKDDTKSERRRDYDSDRKSDKRRDYDDSRNDKRSDRYEDDRRDKDRRRERDDYDRGSSRRERDYRDDDRDRRHRR